MKYHLEIFAFQGRQTLDYFAAQFLSVDDRTFRLEAVYETRTDHRQFHSVNELFIQHNVKAENMVCHSCSGVLKEECHEQIPNK